MAPLEEVKTSYQFSGSYVCSFVCLEFTPSLRGEMGMQECFLGKLEEGARSCWFGGAGV